MKTSFGVFSSCPGKCTQQPKKPQREGESEDWICLSGPQGRHINGQRPGILCGQNCSFSCCSQRPLDVTALAQRGSLVTGRSRRRQEWRGLRERTRKGLGWCAHQDPARSDGRSAPASQRPLATYSPQQGETPEGLIHNK